MSRQPWFIHQSLHTAYVHPDVIIIMHRIRSMGHWRSRSFRFSMSSSATLRFIKNTDQLLAELVSSPCFAVPDQSKWNQDQERRGPPPKPDKVLPCTMQVSTILIPLNCVIHPPGNASQNTPAWEVMDPDVSFLLWSTFIAGAHSCVNITLINMHRSSNGYVLTAVGFSG